MSNAIFNRVRFSHAFASRNIYALVPRPGALPAILAGRFRPISTGTLLTLGVANVPFLVGDIPTFLSAFSDRRIRDFRYENETHTARIELEVTQSTTPMDREAIYLVFPDEWGWMRVSSEDFWESARPVRDAQKREGKYATVERYDAQGNATLFAALVNKDTPA